MTHQGDAAGSTNSIGWLARGLASRGHEVCLGCRPESLLARRFAAAPGGVRIVPMRLPRGVRLAREAFAWKGWVERERIDVVNAHASLDRHLVAYMRLLGCRAVIVQTRRNMARSSGGRARAWLDSRTSDAIVAVSAEVADDLVRRGLPRAHVHVIRNGIPLAELAVGDPARVAALRVALDLPPGTPVVGVVARRKSQDDLLRAAAILARPVVLLFAGVETDPTLDSLKSALAPGSRVVALGFRDDVADLSALFDVFVLPSEIEGFSLALLEAMARGLPCIATDAGGNREALEDGAGLLVPARDPHALAAALAHVFDDPSAARDMAARARDRVRREFDVAKTVERTEQLYAALLAGRRA